MARAGLNQQSHEMRGRGPYIPRDSLYGDSSLEKVIEVGDVPSLSSAHIGHNPRRSSTAMVVKRDTRPGVGNKSRSVQFGSVLTGH
jgi:hypothetical protein